MSINVTDTVDGIHFSKEHWRLWYRNGLGVLKGIYLSTDVVTAADISNPVDMYSDPSVTIVAGDAIYRLLSDGTSTESLKEASADYTAIGYNYIDDKYIAYDNGNEKFVDSSDGFTWEDSAITAPTGVHYAYTTSSVRRIRSSSEYLVVAVQDDFIVGTGALQVWDGTSWSELEVYPEMSTYDYFASSNFELWDNRIFYVNETDELCYYDLGEYFSSESVIDSNTFTTLYKSKYHIYGAGYETTLNRGMIKYFNKNANCVLDMLSSASSAVLFIDISKDEVV